jgi:hypothetical protein
VGRIGSIRNERREVISTALRKEEMAVRANSLIACRTITRQRQRNKQPRIQQPLLSNGSLIKAVTREWLSTEYVEISADVNITEERRFLPGPTRDAGALERSPAGKEAEDTGN